MILEFSGFIRRNYSYIIIATLLVSVVVGFYTAKPGKVLKAYSTLFVVLMIASMGFTITVRSLLLALKDVRGFSLGMALNFVLSPILCYAISRLIPNPEVAAGIILIGVIPCAGMAIVWAGLLKGDVPLAVVINTGTMIAAPFLIPILMLYLAGGYVKINALRMFLNLVYTILIPVLAGIGLRELFERRRDVKKYLPVCPAISSLCAVFLMFIAVNTSMPILLRNLALLPSLLISVIIIFPVMFGFAYLITRSMPYSKTVAITYSSGMKNLPIGLGIAIISFGILTALPIAVGFAFQMLTAVGFYRYFGRMEKVFAVTGGG